MAGRIKYGSIKIPEGSLPPVFGDPPRPPNPSVAPSTAAVEGRTTVSSGAHTAVEHTASADSKANEDGKPNAHGNQRGHQDCDCEMEQADMSVLPSDIPAGINVLLSKFSTTSMNDFGLFASEAMMEQLVDALNPQQYTAVHGLTAPEVKRQSFHCYLKASGLLGAIGKIILSLYETDPLPPVDKVFEHVENLLGYTCSMSNEIAEIKAYNQMLHIRVQRLEVENDWLKRRLDDFGAAVSEIDYLDPDEFDLNLNEERKLPDPIYIKRRHHRPRKRQPLVKPESSTAAETIKTESVDTKVLTDAIRQFDTAEEINLKQSKRVLERITR